MASNTYGAIKLSTAEDVGAVLKKKTGSADGYKPKEWADTINLMGLLPIRAASGSIAHFTDGADAVPLKSLAAQILPKQSGTGTPSPSNPRPISGTSVLNVTRAGANVWDFLKSGQSVYPQGVDEVNKTISWRAYADRDKKMIEGVPFKANTQYTFILKLYRDTAVNVGGSYGANMGIKYTDGTSQPISYICEGRNVFVTFAVTSTANKTIDSLYVFNNGGNTVLKYEESGVFEGVLTTADFETYTATTTPAPLARTIYGGSAEVVGGSGEETHGVVDLGSLTWTKQTMQNGSGFTARIEDGNPIGNVNSSGALCENYPEDTSVQNAYYINDKTFKYGGTYFGRRNITILDSDLSNLSTTDFKTAMSGVKLCYPLETPSSFTFDGVRVESEEGVNNVWTDAGDVTVEYRADINLLIAELGG